MDNSISQNFRRRKTDNPISALSFYWIAEFDDNCIFQFENDKEHRFQEVIDRLHNLKYFTLQHKEKELSFTVDLINGNITFNKKCPIKIDNNNKDNIRLIFFRRHRVNLTESMQELSHNIEYHLGFQYNKNGQNRKIILIVDNEGNFVIQED